MSDLVRVPLDDGGFIMIKAIPNEAEAPMTSPGPVRAGRTADRIEDAVVIASASLRQALEPITQMAQQVLDQLVRVRPHELKVEFGVELTAEAGAVLTKAGAGCHLTVSLSWSEPDGHGKTR